MVEMCLYISDFNNKYIQTGGSIIDIDYLKINKINKILYDNKSNHVMDKSDTLIRISNIFNLSCNYNFRLVDTKKEKYRDVESYIYDIYEIFSLK
jgi:hypothetical protein